MNYAIRGGKPVAADEVFRAWTSGDLARMIAAAELPTWPTDRHFLLLRIVELTFAQREDRAAAAQCELYAALHLRELKTILPSVMADLRVKAPPRIPTFERYATVLAERGEYELAIDVCKTAITYGLEDGTKGGYQGRIERFRKAKAKNMRDAHAARSRRRISPFPVMGQPLVELADRRGAEGRQ
jgi:hypothetical protein